MKIKFQPDGSAIITLGGFNQTVNFAPGWTTTQFVPEVAEQIPQEGMQQIALGILNHYLMPRIEESEPEPDLEIRIGPDRFTLIEVGEEIPHEIVLCDSRALLDGDNSAECANGSGTGSGSRTGIDL